MKTIAAMLLGIGTLISGCADFGTPHRALDQEQKKANEPVDRNHNSVPDSLERKAVPLEPVFEPAL